MAFMSCEVAYRRAVTLGGRKKPSTSDDVDLRFDKALDVWDPSETSASSVKAEPGVFYHELSHDLESFFWVMVWLVRVILWHMHTFVRQMAQCPSRA